MVHPEGPPKKKRFTPTDFQNEQPVQFCLESARILGSWVAFEHAGSFWQHRRARGGRGGRVECRWAVQSVEILRYFC